MTNTNSVVVYHYRNIAEIIVYLSKYYTPRMKTCSEHIISKLKSPIVNLELEEINWQIAAMSYDEVCSLYQDLSNLSETREIGQAFVYNWDIIHRLCRHLRRLKMDFEGGNKTIGTLIKEFRATHSEEVAEELYDRFRYQSFDDQKRIISILLCPDYMERTYTIMNDLLGKVFLKRLQRYWLNDGDIGVFKYTIKYSNEEFLLKYIAKLSTHRSFYHLICLRIGHMSEFIINPNMFSNRWEYYTVLCVLKRGVSEDDILHELFGSIKDVLSNAEDSYNNFISMHTYIGKNKYYMSVKIVLDIHNALIAMRDAQLHYIMHIFYDWDTVIQHKYQEALSTLYNEIEEDMSPLGEWQLYCKIAKQNLPSLTSQSTECRDCLLQDLRPMIDKFELEVSDSQYDNCEPRRITLPFY